MTQQNPASPDGELDDFEKWFATLPRAVQQGRFSASYYMREAWNAAFASAPRPDGEMVSVKREKITLLADEIERVAKDSPAMKAWVEYLRCFLASSAPRPDVPKPIGIHRLEEIDVDGRQVCSRCGTADSDELAAPCPAISDGEMYKLGNPRPDADAKLAEALQECERLRAALESVAIGDIAAERKRQIDQEGWSLERDDSYVHGQLARAAACYALGWVESTYGPSLWPRDWDLRWWKPTERRRDLVKAGALITAEIERIDRRALGAAK